MTMAEPRHMPATIKPLPLPGGTSHPLLMVQQTTILERLTELLEDMARATPHGKDYLPDEMRYRAARTEHARRTMLLRELGEQVGADLKYLMGRSDA